MVEVNSERKWISRARIENPWSKSAIMEWQSESSSIQVSGCYMKFDSQLIYMCLNIVQSVDGTTSFMFFFYLFFY